MSPSKGFRARTSGGSRPPRRPQGPGVPSAPGDEGPVPPPDDPGLRNRGSEEVGAESREMARKRLEAVEMLRAASRPAGPGTGPPAEPQPPQDPSAQQAKKPR
jgi:hypothetical protein